MIGYFLPFTALALDYVPLAPLPVGEGGASLTRVTDAGQYIKGAFNLAIGIAAVLAIIMIVIGGIQYMGTESIGGKGAGLKKIKDAVLGLLLALGSYVLLFTINPALTNFNLNIKDVSSTLPSTKPVDKPNYKYVLNYVEIEYLLLIYPKGTDPNSPGNAPALKSMGYNIFTKCKEEREKTLKTFPDAVIATNCLASPKTGTEKKILYDFEKRYECISALKTFQAVAKVSAQTFQIISACTLQQDI